MEITGPVQVVLQLETTDSTISGRISVAGAPPTDFFGWLELIDRLERAASGTAGALAVAAEQGTAHTKGV
jgi:hypothetical protein